MLPSGCSAQGPRKTSRAYTQARTESLITLAESLITLARVESELPDESEEA
ncbi:MAG TPA: hypothetical protein PK322_15850 [Opitutaceae bacterium]|nr:hypothetical protein [Opitutaceae bacterium]